MRYYVKFYPSGLKSFCTTENDSIDFDLLNEQEDTHFAEITQQKYNEMKIANSLTDEDKNKPKHEIEKLCRQKALLVDSLYPPKPEKTPEQSFKIGQYKAQQLAISVAKANEEKLIRDKMRELAVEELQKEGKI